MASLQIYTYWPAFDSLKHLQEAEFVTSDAILIAFMTVKALKVE